MTGLTSRRGVLVGAGALGAGAIVVACGGKGAQSSPTSGPNATTTATSATSATPGTSGGLNVRDVPVGGGTVLKDQDIVVTQPQAGQFKAFSATCTHRGCQVNDVTDGAIKCPCHGSMFSATDGTVVTGPATQPLPEKSVIVTGDTLTFP
jgi:Rieske Fe-S protein